MMTTSPLGRLIAPVSVSTFLNEYFEKKPLLVRGASPTRFEGYVTSRDVDRCVTTLGMHHPELSLVDNTRTLDAAEYTFPSGMIDVARFYKLFSEGATIIAPNLERKHMPLAELCRGLECELSTRFQANIYLTPPNSQGFRTHYDTHDVIVLQVEGSKHWMLYDTPVELPFRGQDYHPKHTPAGPVSEEFDLNPGDVLYLPRGVMHDARAMTGSSLHITLGLMFTSWTDLLVEALGAVGLSDPRFRASLPVGFARDGFDRTAARKHFRELLAVLAERAEFDHALDHYADDLISTRHPLLPGQMAQALSAQGIHEDTLVGATPDLLYKFTEKGDVVVLSCLGHDLSMPIGAKDALRFAITHERFRVKELPDGIDAASKVVLARRLVREGILRQL